MNQNLRFTFSPTSSGPKLGQKTWNWKLKNSKILSNWPWFLYITRVFLLSECPTLNQVMMHFTFNGSARKKDYQSLFEIYGNKIPMPKMSLKFRAKRHWYLFYLACNSNGHTYNLKTLYSLMYYNTKAIVSYSCCLW